MVETIAVIAGDGIGPEVTREAMKVLGAMGGLRFESLRERWGTPEDIAKAARFLVSREADYITGQVININGGAVR